MHVYIVYVSDKKKHTPDSLPNFLKLINVSMWYNTNNDWVEVAALNYQPEVEYVIHGDA